MKNQRWWNAPADAEGASTVFTVVELQVHEPSAWKLQALDRVAVLVSNATAALLARLERDLVVKMDEEDPKKLATADLVFTVNAERAGRIQKLLAQDKRDTRGERRMFSNAYRFVACEATDDPDRFRVAARLALGSWQDRVIRGKPARTHSVSLIQATTGLQQLLATYYGSSLLELLPSALIPGVCQEAAQQVSSYLGQIASAKVKGEVNFPTVEDRDPERRQREYEQALDALCHDLRPLNYARARDLYPKDYAPDDPRGDRLIVNDERWFAVTRRPDPHPIPLFFVQGAMVKLLEGRARFDAACSKTDRHRSGRTTRDVSADRPEQIRQKGGTGLQAWFAELPLLDCEDETVVAAIKQRHLGSGRHLDLDLHLMPLMGEGKWRPRKNGFLVPLSGDRTRLERILRRSDLEIAWTRLVQKGGAWYLQLTLRIKTTQPIETNRILGIAFGLDAIATWHLVDRAGNTLDQGAIAPNAQIQDFLTGKREVEWDQVKGRWVGGHGFAKQLEATAHKVANQLVALANTHGARLAVEDISYVQKAGRDHTANVLFTAWNYGQLCRFLQYKGPLAGQAKPLYTSDYITNLTCPKCGAIRGKNQDKEHATTWRENGTLHCRACGWSGILTAAQHAERVARYALSLLK